MSARLKIWMIRTGLTYAVLTGLGMIARMAQPAIAAIPLSMMFWEWIGAISFWWRLRKFGRSVETSRFVWKARQAKSSTAQSVTLFDHVLEAAGRVFPKAADPRPSLDLVVFPESGWIPSSPFLMRVPISGYSVFYPEGLLSLHPVAQQFVVAHEITHYCLRKKWHHIFPRALFWASSAAALATAFLPGHASRFALAAFAATWAASLLLVHMVSRYKERLTDEGAVRIILELEAEKQQQQQEKLQAQRDIDWGNVVAHTFESLVPKPIKWLRYYAGLNVQFWPSSVSFSASHPPPVTRAKAVRKHIARFRESEARAMTARRRFLDRCVLKGRKCDCGSGNWYDACCGRMPKFDVTPWRC